MTINPQLFGKEAEAAAEQYLRKQGYRILDRNVRTSNGELDIVASVANTVVFIEVKARQTDHFGGAQYAVTRQKERRLVQLAAQYLAQHQLQGQLCRFDVMLYQGNLSASPHLEHIENAFEVSGDDLRW